MHFFRWLDKLGLAARLGHEVVIREQFASGSYALLDKERNPNPVCGYHEDLLSINLSVNHSISESVHRSTPSVC